jgi:hypothetical protein
MARIDEIHRLVARARDPLTPAHRSFDATLAGINEPGGVYDSSLPGAGAGLRALAAATSELGVREEPPGSNDGQRIAGYRAAVVGSAPGVPWCAYFVSWAAAQAGTPVGEEGQGYGAVEQVQAWADRTGRLLPPGTLPKPGDLILYGSAHVGIVESVGPGERMTTIEGNHQDAVQRVDRSLGEATGFVRL